MFKPVNRGTLKRRLWSVPGLRSVGVRRWLWDRRNHLHACRRAIYERLGSDRHSHPALHGMDRKLAARLPHRGGFFVEAGAHDGFTQSNTYWLERFRGWTGLLVEPVPHQCRQARRRRRVPVVNCALVGEAEAGSTVSLRYGNLMTVVVGARGGEAEERSHVGAGDLEGLDEVGYEIEVTARTLTDVLAENEAPRDFDLLSLDVEGYESSVLRGLDLERFHPRLMLIEMDGSERRRQEVEAVIGRDYEYVERFSPLDLLYARRGESAPATPDAG